MTQLELVISKIEKLPPAEQNQFAAWILEELRSEKRWAKLFAKSGDVLSELADEALAEHRAKFIQPAPSIPCGSGWPIARLAFSMVRTSSGIGSAPMPSMTN